MLRCCLGDPPPVPRCLNNLIAGTIKVNHCGARRLMLSFSACITGMRARVMRPAALPLYPSPLPIHDYYGTDTP